MLYKYKLFTFRGQKHAGLGRAAHEAEHWATASRVSEPSWKEGLPGLEGSTSRSLCEVERGWGGRGSSARKGGAVPPPCAPYAGPSGSGSPR